MKHLSTALTLLIATLLPQAAAGQDLGDLNIDPTTGAPVYTPFILGSI